MKLYVSLPKEKVERLRSVPLGVEFLPLNGARSSEGSVAAVVRSPSFREDLAAALALGVPVVVVAGSEDAEGRKCAEEALALGVPAECVLVKRNDRAVTLDGRDFGPAPRGVGARALAAAARRALEEKLIPDVLVWEEPEDVPVLGEEEEPVRAVPGAARVATLALPEALTLAERVVAVFRAGAAGGEAAKALADAASGVLLELSPEPGCFPLFASTFEGALATRRYLWSDGGLVQACAYTGASLLVADADLSVPRPEGLSEVQREAEAKGKVFVAAGQGIEEARSLVEHFRKSGWRLDGVLPARPELKKRLAGAFGSLLIPEPALALS